MRSNAAVITAEVLIETATLLVGASVTESPQDTEAKAKKFILLRPLRANGGPDGALRAALLETHLQMTRKVDLKSLVLHHHLTELLVQ